MGVAVPEPDKFDMSIRIDSQIDWHYSGQYRDPNNATRIVEEGPNCGKLNLFQVVSFCFVHLCLSLSTPSNNSKVFVFLPLILFALLFLPLCPRQNASKLGTS
jgi:hypothetical protein